MEKRFEGSLLYCLDKDEINFVVLVFDGTASVYNTDMELLRKAELPFAPLSFLTVTENKILFFSAGNDLCILNVTSGKCVKIGSPRGTSIHKRLADCTAFKVYDGILFIPSSFYVGDKSFFYELATGKFKRIDIKLPDFYFTFAAGKRSVIYHQVGEMGNLEACTFKTAFERRGFIPEMTMAKELFSPYLSTWDAFDLPIKLAFIGVEERKLILAGRNGLELRQNASLTSKKDDNPEKLISDLKALCNSPRTGKVVLITDGGPEKEVHLDGFVKKTSYSPFYDHVVFVEHDDVVEAYSAEDLTLLASWKTRLRYPTMLFSNGTVIYEAKDGVCVTDSSPFSEALRRR
ncbi:MAG: hypothetical protein K6B51_00180 [Bacilli bacterium]|nr:hypothetical protein [Bacilli bacterium]